MIEIAVIVVIFAALIVLGYTLYPLIYIAAAIALAALIWRLLATRKPPPV